MTKIPEATMKKLVPNPKDGWPFGEGRALMCLVSLAPSEPGFYEAPQVYALANGIQLTPGKKVEITRHVWNKIKGTRSGDGTRGRPLFTFEEHPGSPTIEEFVEANADRVNAYEAKLQEEKEKASKALTPDPAAKTEDPEAAAGAPKALEPSSAEPASEGGGRGRKFKRAGA